MSKIITLEQVEKLAENLSPAQRLELAAHICKQLSIAQGFDQVKEPEDQKIQLAKELFSEVEDIEDDSQGDFDSVTDVNRLRKERIKHICQNDV